MAKVFGLRWAFEAFEQDSTFITKRMFGSLAAYVNGKMVMLLSENPGEREYRGKIYDFDIWNGVLLPTERQHHPQLQKDYPELRPHPVLPKWLYLPMNDDDFEETISEISQRIARNDSLFGVYPQPKKSRKVTRK